MDSLLISACTWTSILGSLVLKLPQMLTLWTTGSVAGISLQGVLLETIYYALALTYNVIRGYPLLSYLEYALLVPQDLLLLLLILHLSNSLTLNWVGSLGIAAALCTSAASGNISLALMETIFKFSLPIGWSSKVLQLRVILETRDARAVSLLSWSLSALTCATRIVTTAATSSDTNLLITFTVSLTLNLAIVTAAYVYRRGPPAARVRKEQHPDEQVEDHGTTESWNKQEEQQPTAPVDDPIQGKKID